MSGEWRQRLMNGAYTIRASGLYQLDKDVFLRDDGARRRRAIAICAARIETTGQFALNDSWVWGWDGVLPTDQTFFQDYHLRTYQRGVSVLPNRLYRRRLAALPHRPRRPQLFRRPHDLLLRLLRSRRAGADSGHPSGGRLQLHLRPAGVRRRTRLSHQPDQPSRARPPPSIRSRRRAFNSSLCAPTTADPLQKNPANCLLRGIPGHLHRASRPRRTGSAASPIRSARYSRRS